MEKTYFYNILYQLITVSLVKHSIILFFTKLQTMLLSNPIIVLSLLILRNKRPNKSHVSRETTTQTTTQTTQTTTQTKIKIHTIKYQSHQLIFYRNNDECMMMNYNRLIFNIIICYTRL
jgi:hypothetical protein